MDKQFPLPSMWSTNSSPGTRFCLHRQGVSQPNPLRLDDPLDRDFNFVPRVGNKGIGLRKKGSIENTGVSVFRAAKQTVFGAPKTPIKAKNMTKNRRVLGQKSTFWVSQDQR